MFGFVGNIYLYRYLISSLTMMEKTIDAGPPREIYPRDLSKYTGQKLALFNVLLFFLFCKGL